jgi:hypothetical protein
LSIGFFSFFGITRPAGRTLTFFAAPTVAIPAVVRPTVAVTKPFPNPDAAARLAVTSTEAFPDPDASTLTRLGVAVTEDFLDSDAVAVNFFFLGGGIVAATFEGGSIAFVPAFFGGFLCKIKRFRQVPT